MGGPRNKPLPDAQGGLTSQDIAPRSRDARTPAGEDVFAGTSASCAPRPAGTVRGRRTADVDGTPAGRLLRQPSAWPKTTAWSPAILNEPYVRHRGSDEFRFGSTWAWVELLENPPPGRVILVVHSSVIDATLRWAFGLGPDAPG